MLNLKEIRESYGLQQKDIAQKLNRTIACISSWETGKTEPSIDDLIQLASILKVSVDNLINNSDEYKQKIEYNTLSQPELQILNTVKKLKTEQKYQVLGFAKSFINKD